MAKIAILSYIKRNSLVHELTGTTKLIFFLAWSVASMVTYDTRVLVCMLLVSAVVFKISRIRVRDISVVLGLAAVFLLLNNLFVYLFAPEYGVELYESRTVLLTIAGPYTITLQQLFYHLNMTMKVICVVPVALLFIACTDPSEFAASLSSIGVSYRIGHSIDEVRGLLTAMKLDRKIKIAFDEWNLRGWYHPNVHTIRQGRTKEEYLYPRDLNDDNTRYTMADAVFTACFLNELNRNCDIVGMANYAPIVNTRGCIYTWQEGIVLRSTYHVFDLYVNYMGDVVLDAWSEEMPKLFVKHKNGADLTVDALDVLVTGWSDQEGIAVAVVNKDPEKEQTVTLDLTALSQLPKGQMQAVLYTVSGNTTESYNDVDHEEVKIVERQPALLGNEMDVVFLPHSVNVVVIR